MIQFFPAPTKELAQNGFGGTRILTRLGACTRLGLVWASGWFPSWRKTPDRGLGAPAAQRGQRRSRRRRPPPPSDQSDGFARPAPRRRPGHRPPSPRRKPSASREPRAGAGPAWSPAQPPPRVPRRPRPAPGLRAMGRPGPAAGAGAQRDTGKGRWGPRAGLAAESVPRTGDAAERGSICAAGERLRGARASGAGGVLSVQPHQGAGPPTAGGRSLGESNCPAWGAVAP